ncbi:hypothetical protein KP509_34G039200 [Ceratopteris richardii]|nr:hypothetical protein KP509_34G039200 [Ceratopteris richardii]
MVTNEYSTSQSTLTSDTWNKIILRQMKHGRPDMVFEVFQKMSEVNVKPDSYTFSFLVKATGSLNTLLHGYTVHTLIMLNELDKDLVLSNGLIDMYAKCGSLYDAYNTFEHLSNGDAVSWGTMVAAYVQKGQYLAGLKLFMKMQASGLKPTHVTLLVALKACAGMEAISWGKVLHIHIIESANESDALIGTTLIDFYAKRGQLDDAVCVFEKLKSRNVVSWSALIGGYVKHGENAQALKLFENMQKGCVSPSKVTFLCVLKACGKIEALKQGRLIHNQIILSGVQVDMLVGSSLLDMYAKCGVLDEAQQLFNHLPKRDVVSWSAMIAGYSQQGYNIHALQCFEKMQQGKVGSNKVTYLCCLKACGNAEALFQGQLIHDMIIRDNLESDDMVGCSLIDMYGKCGCLTDAHVLFQLLRNPDAVAWGAMIAAYVHQEQGLVALDLFCKMQSKFVRPDKFIFSCTLKACGLVGALSDARRLYYQVINSGFDSDRVINNALVDMFAKCGSPQEARIVFDNMPSRDTVTWGAMIAAYVQNELNFLALELFDDLCESHLKPDKVIYVSTLIACGNACALEQGKFVHEHILESRIERDEVLGSNLVEMYVKCSNLEEARNVFDEWPKQSIVSWDVIIAGYIDHGLRDGGLELFEKLLEQRLEPNKAIFSSILKACGMAGALDKGRLLHNMIIKAQLEKDVAIASTLVDMHAKCGSLYEAHSLLNRLADRNVVSWGALISGYAEHGNFSMVRQCLQAMENDGVMPNDTIFLNILSACSHTAHLHEGLNLFKFMEKYDTQKGPEHFSCMIDLLGRAGCLMEAKDVLNSVPLFLNGAGWTSLLGNSNAHGNLLVGNHCL